MCGARSTTRLERARILLLNRAVLPETSCSLPENSRQAIFASAATISQATSRASCRYVVLAGFLNPELVHSAKSIRIVDLEGRPVAQFNARWVIGKVRSILMQHASIHFEADEVKVTIGKERLDLT